MITVKKSKNIRFWLAKQPKIHILSRNHQSHWRTICFWYIKVILQCFAFCFCHFVTRCYQSFFLLFFHIFATKAFPLLLLLLLSLIAKTCKKCILISLSISNFFLPGKVLLSLLLCFKRVLWVWIQSVIIFLGKNDQFDFFAMYWDSIHGFGQFPNCNVKYTINDTTMYIFLLGIPFLCIIWCIFLMVSLMVILNTCFPGKNNDL